MEFNYTSSVVELYSSLSTQIDDLRSVMSDFIESYERTLANSIDTVDALKHAIKDIIMADII